MAISDIKNRVMTLDQRLWHACGFASLGQAIVRHRAWLLALWVMAIVAHAFDIFNFTLSIDDELHAQESGPKLAWAHQSRWGMYILNQLVLPDTVFPVIPMLVAVTFIALASHFLVKLLSDHSAGGDFPAAALFIACPTLYFVLSFETLGYGVGIGWFFCALSLYWYFEHSGFKRYWAIPLMAFAFAIYQAFMLASVVLFQCYLLALILGTRRVASGQAVTFMTLLRSVLHYAVLLGLAVLSYWAINKGYFRYYEFEKNDYLVGFVDIQWTKEYFENAWQGLCDAMAGYYLGGADFYVTEIVELPWLFWSAISLVALLVLFSPVSWLVRVLGLLLLAVTVYTPFLMNLMNGGFMPARTLLGVPAALAGLSLLAARVPLRLLRVAFIVLMTIVAFRFVVTNNRMAFSEYMTREADRELISQVMARAGEVVTKFKDYGDRRQPWPAVLVGYHRYYESPTLFSRNSVGASFFIWGGDIRRIISVMRMMGYNDYRGATPEEHQRVMDYAVQMPIWPAPGSVDVYDGILIVKMEGYIAPQLEVACAKSESNRVCRAFYECKRNNTMPYCERAILPNQGQ